jgi:hypothetical protein
MGERTDTGATTMDEHAIRRINFYSFVTGLSAIVAGVAVGILGVWSVVPPGGLLWRLLGSDAIVFAGAVLTNLSIACYRNPGRAAG